MQTTELRWNGGSPRQFRACAKVALRKLDMMDAAKKLGDLTIPPNNKLEALAGDRKGQHSIRINDHWRLCL
jgi:toxin HigB-1